MEITRRSDRTHERGSADWFTGDVDVLEIVASEVLLATFGPGARSAWHSHAHGQTVHIVSGPARVGRDDGTVVVLQAGDRATFAPGERHWHGAGPEGEMSHIAVARPDEHGATVEWGAQVTDAEFDA